MDEVIGEIYRYGIKGRLNISSLVIEVLEGLDSFTLTNNFDYLKGFRIFTK